MNTFVLGVQYYGPPHTKEEDWIEDFRLIREHGLDSVKVWAIWGYLEPAPDKYDFGEWDRLFDVAQRYGINVVPNTVIEIQPFWIHRLFPEAYMFDQHGRPIISTTGEYSCGISPGACLDHSGPRKQAEKFLTCIAGHFKDRENLLCWDAWNETRWQDNVIEYGPNWVATYLRVPCYCDKTVEKFRRWLENKYSSLGELNMKWRRKYVDWVDVFPPRGGIWSYGYPEMVDWRNFMTDYVVDKLELRVNSLRKGDPRHQIMMHTGTSSIRSLDMTCLRASDDWKNSKITDFYGTSFYPGDYRRGMAELNCLALDGIRCASGDKPFWISELQGGPSFHSPGRGNNYYPQDLKFWTFCTLSHGAKGILYWSWRPEPFGPETLGFGLTLFDGTPTVRTRMVKEISKVIKKYESLFLISKAYPSHVAILFDPDLYFINFYGGTGGMEKDMIFNSIHGYYKAFWENNIGCDFVHPDRMEGLRNYKLLVLPFAFCLKKQVAKKIEEYVKTGGAVLAEAYLCRFKEGCEPATTFPAYGLHEVFKVKETEAEFVDAVKVIPDRDKKIFEGIDYAVGYYFKEILEPLHGSEILGRFEDGTPAVIKNKYGGGETIFFGSLMGLDYPKTTDGNFRKTIGNISRLAGISSPVEIVSSKDEIRTRILTCNKSYLIFCLNYGEKCETKLRLHLPAPKSVKEIIANSNIEYLVKESYTEVNFEMNREDVKILLYTTKK